jgi:mannose-6-phosphate isomerase-like protein (cupin superfamily)
MHDSTLADFCRALEQVFSCHVQTNIYLTPPNAQGFAAHYDNHDVFVLQVEGEKRWRLYQTPVDMPYRGEAFRRGAYDPGAPTQEFTLKAGDCAYIPRGLMHDADTGGDCESLHITAGLIVRTWADLLLEAVSAVALTEPEFRRSLPPGFGRVGFDRSGAERTFAGLIETLAKKAELGASFDLFVDNFIRSRTPNIAGAILDAARPIVEADRFRMRPFTPWRLAEDGDDLVLITAGGDVTFTPGERAALERIADGGAVTIADLAGLGAPDPTEMLRKLQAFGFVERMG